MIPSGKIAAHRALQQVLRRPITQSEAGGNRCGEFDEPVIEQRRARFNRMRHRHSIDLREDVERQVRLEVAILERRHPIGPDAAELR